MARLATLLFTGASPTADGLTQYFADARGSYVTSPTPTEGTNMLMEDASAATRKEDVFVLTTALATTYFHSVEFQYNANPVGGAVRFFQMENTMGLFIGTTGAVHAETPGGATIGGTSSALSANTRYRVEYTELINSGAADDTFRFAIYPSGSRTAIMDAGLLTAQTIATAAPGNTIFGANSTGHTSPWTCYFSRWILNDSTGSSENGMPDPWMPTTHLNKYTRMRKR